MPIGEVSFIIAPSAVMVRPPSTPSDPLGFWDTLSGLKAVTGEKYSAMPSFCSSVVALSSQSSRKNAIIAVTKRSEEHTSELQSLMRISYAVFCLKKKQK